MSFINLKAFDLNLGQCYCKLTDGYQNQTDYNRNELNAQQTLVQLVSLNARILPAVEGQAE